MTPVTVCGEGLGTNSIMGTSEEPARTVWLGGVEPPSATVTGTVVVLQAAVSFEVFGSVGPGSSGAPALLTVTELQLAITLGKLSAGRSGWGFGTVASRTVTVVLSPAGSMARLQLKPEQYPSAMDIPPSTFSVSDAMACRRTKT